MEGDVLEVKGKKNIKGVIQMLERVKPVQMLKKIGGKSGEVFSSLTVRGKRE